MAHLPLHTTDHFNGSSDAGLYGDIMQAIDWSAGEILSTLKKQGIDENTLVVFTSDNGPWLELPDRMLQAGIRPWHAGSPGPFRKAKATTYEGGVRVPGILRWPGRIPAGLTSNEIASNLDLFPTFLKLAGGQPPKDRTIDGIDLMPLLSGNTSMGRDEFYYFRGGDRLQAVREGEWKLRYTSNNRDDLDAGDPVTPELFHLKRDPSERYNVAVEYPDIVDKLKKKLVRFAQEVDAEIEIPQNERN
jgi:arylsulfatase A-like enzyme